MKHIEVAYELLSEARHAREAYRNFPNQFELVKAHMYSIFESYAYGVIDWETVQTKWHNSIKEYLSLYKGNRQQYLSESAHMFNEYERALREYKPALDEFKRVSEKKMTSTLVVKKHLSESFAQKKSEFYYNERCLNESELKDITRLKSWTRVKENYPHLTDNDEDRVRFLTVFEAPTVKTTQLINMLHEYSTTPEATPTGPSAQDRMQDQFRNQDDIRNMRNIERSLRRIIDPKDPEAQEPIDIDPPANRNNRISSLTREGKYAKKKRKIKEAAPTSSLRPIARPMSNVGRTEMSPGGVMSGSTRGVNQILEPEIDFNPNFGQRDQISHPENRGLASFGGSAQAPRTSTRPQTRPARIAQRGAINSAVRDAMGESVNLDQALDAIDKNFSPERTEIQDTAVAYARAAAMIQKGKTQSAMQMLSSNGFDFADVGELKQAIQELLRSETELKNQEEVYRFSATPNIRNLTNALKKLEGGEKFDETTTAGGIATVSQPLGAIQRRNPTSKKKVKETEAKKGVDGKRCWKGKKIHPTKPTKMKGGKRVDNCIDAGKK